MAVIKRLLLGLIGVLLILGSMGLIIQQDWRYWALGALPFLAGVALLRLGLGYSRGFRRSLRFF